MDDKVDLDFLLIDSRARVYLLWAVITSVGFVATHLFQNKLINGVWATLSVIGLGFMFRVMPLQVKQMKRIFTAWLVPITAGMVVSGLVFYQNSAAAGNLIAHLGAFWMIIMAIGYLWNGLVDPPRTWYWFATILNTVFGILCFTVDSLQPAQYLIAAIVSAWSMLYLWLFRT
jgi:hypothetical protein